MNFRQHLSLLAVANVIPFILPKQLFFAFFSRKKQVFELKLFTERKIKYEFTFLLKRATKVIDLFQLCKHKI